jgi:hypothetical protein
MELSRKVISRHWWKFFGFSVVIALLLFAGAMACGIGVFIAVPLVIASLTYAYEDIFGGITGIVQHPPKSGPFGTAVSPEIPPVITRPAGRSWSTATKIGLAVAVLVIFFMIVVRLFLVNKPMRVPNQPATAPASVWDAQATSPPMAAPAPAATNNFPLLSTEARTNLVEALNERMEAATSINDSSEKEKVAAVIAIDAAKVGETDLVTQALSQISDQAERDQTTAAAAMLLAKSGLRKPAIDLARSISDEDTRNKILSVLAQ